MSRISDLAGFTTALSTTEDLSVGIITASSFSGDGSGLTGVASTDNIQTATSAKFLSNVNVSGITTLTTLQVTGLTTVGVVTGGTSVSATHFYGDGSSLTGIDASSIKSGGAVKAQAVGTGVVVTGVLTATTMSATSAVFDGNVTVGGTITYQDATNMDVLGISTFQQGVQVLANGLDITGFSTFKTGVTVTGFATATGYKVGAAISITDGAVSATRFHGDGGNLTGISVGISTESITATDQSIATLNLSKDAHKVSVSGVATIDCQGGSEYSSHILTIENTGIATVGFSTYFLFPSGAEPSLPTSSGAISQLSFTVHRVGAAGTQVLTTAAVNFS